MFRAFVALVVLGVVGACTEAVPVVVNPPPAEAVQPSSAGVDELPGPRATQRAFVQVVTAMEPVAERECMRRTVDVNCDFLIVVDDDVRAEPNAFQTLDENGRPLIIFTLALLDDARNVDEIAFVLGHEAAHHIAGHLSQQRQNATLGAVIFGGLATATGGTVSDIERAQRLGARLGVRTYSKEFELEADALGTILAARAGFSPIRGAEFFNRIPDPGDRFLGTHPPNAERIATVRRVAAGL